MLRKLIRTHPVVFPLLLMALMIPGLIVMFFVPHPGTTGIPLFTSPWKMVFLGFLVVWVIVVFLPSSAFGGNFGWLQRSRDLAETSKQHVVRMRAYLVWSILLIAGLVLISWLARVDVLKIPKAVLIGTFWASVCIGSMYYLRIKHHMKTPIDYISYFGTVLVVPYGVVQLFL